MSLLIDGTSALISIFRSVLFAAAVLLALVCIVDWAVRTRRISPFNSVARFFRSSVDPLIKPVERRVVRAGGLPSSAPLWAFIAVLVGGILLLTLLDFVRGQLVAVETQTSAGPAGVAHLAISAIFSLFRIAIIVAVVSSWLPISPYSKWVRWSHRLSEPVLAPLRRVIPSIGGIDITPILAYFLLGLIESAIFHAFGLL
jgi:YggT family protein